MGWAPRIFLHFWTGRNRLVFAGLMAISLLFQTSCSEKQNTKGKQHTLTVAVSIAPLFTFAEQLAPENARVSMLIPPGVSPHGYEPNPGQISTLAEADIVLLNGLGIDDVFRGPLQRIGNEDRHVLVFADICGLADNDKDKTDDHAGNAEQSEPAEHHHHDLQTDPHLWLDPGLVLKLIDPLREVFLQVAENDDQRLAIKAAAEKTRNRVLEIDRQYRERLAPFSGYAFIAEHPAWNRIARRYGLKAAGFLRLIPRVEPTPKVVDELVRQIKKENVRVIVVEPQFPSATADRLAELTGIRVVRLDPLGEGDWFAMMQANLDSIVEGFRSEH